MCIYTFFVFLLRHIRKVHFNSTTKFVLLFFFFVLLSLHPRVGVVYAKAAMPFFFVVVIVFSSSGVHAGEEVYHASCVFLLSLSLSFPVYCYFFFSASAFSWPFFFCNLFLFFFVSAMRAFPANNRECIIVIIFERWANFSLSLSLFFFF